MIKLLIVATLAALASAGDHDALNGGWQIVKIFPDIPGMTKKCQVLNVTITTYATTDPECGNSDVSYLTIKHNNETVRPVIFVKTQEEVANALKTTCAETDDHFVARSVTDGYFTLHFISDSGETTMLMAKEVPTEAQLVEVVKTHGLKDTPGVNICTRELEQANSLRRVLETQHHHSCKVTELLAVRKNTGKTSS